MENQNTNPERAQYPDPTKPVFKPQRQLPLPSKSWIIFIAANIIIPLTFAALYLNLTKNSEPKETAQTPTSPPTQTPTPTPKPSKSPTPKINREKVVKYIILKNITVCNVTSDCLNLTLSDNDVNKVKSEVEDFQNTVNEWAGKKLRLKVEPVIVSENIKTELTSFSYPADGWTLKRENVADAIRQNVDTNTDFVILTNPIKDQASGYEVPVSACGYSYGATDFDSVGGTGYSWIPINCAHKDSMIHEWLHQVTFNLRDFNGLNDIYNGNYPKELCGNTKPEDDFRWFPDIDQADKVPDFEACKEYYGKWNQYCSDIKPEDCGFKFDKHVLQKHFPDDIDFIGNYCRDGKKDFTETSVDTGPECSQS